MVRFDAHYYDTTMTRRSATEVATGESALSHQEPQDQDIDDYEHQKKSQGTVAQRALRINVVVILSMVVLASVALAGRGHARHERRLRFVEEQRRVLVVEQEKTAALQQALQHKDSLVQAGTNVLQKESTEANEHKLHIKDEILHFQKHEQTIEFLNKELGTARQEVQSLQVQNDQQVEKVQQVEQEVRQAEEPPSPLTLDGVAERVDGAVSRAQDLVQEVAEPLVGAETAQTVHQVVDQGLESVGEMVDKSVEWAARAFQETKNDNEENVEVENKYEDVVEEQTESDLVINSRHPPPADPPVAMAMPQ